MTECSPTPRSITEGLDWFLSHNPSGSGLCAKHTWQSLGGDRGCPPAWGCANANEVYDKVKASGRYWTTPRRGDIALWKYGNNGHAARVYDEAGTKIATTDPSNGEMVGVEPIGYPAKWGATSSARIFTDTYNGVRCFDSSDSGGPYVTEHVYRSKCGYGEPTNGDSDSDTVKELQERLNRISLEGGQELPITGRYDVETDDEVRKWQEQVCDDVPDPALQSYLGPSQFARMFPDDVYVLHDDGNAAIASGGTDGGGSAAPPTKNGTTLGEYLTEIGFVVDDDDVPQGRDSTWRNVEFLMVHHTASPDSHSESGDAAYIRTGGSNPEANDLYPPLAQIMLGRSSKVWMCCYEKSGQEAPGRASHAGSGHGYGIPDDSMNERCLGIEVQNDGTKPISSNPAQYDTLIELLAELREFFNVPKANVIGHKEWSDSGKTDPLDDMGKIRQDVEDLMHPPSESIPPPIELPESITFPLGIQYHYSGKPGGTFSFGGSKKYLDVATWAPTKKGFTLGMIYANVDIDGEFRSYLARQPYGDEGIDETAFQTHFGDEGGDNYTLTHVWFEKAEANRGLKYGLYSVDGQSGSVGTRYVKFLFIPEDVFVDLGNVLGVYSAAREVYTYTKRYLPKALVALFIAWVVKQLREVGR